MTLDQKINAWVEEISLGNDGSRIDWLARFLIDGYWPATGALEDLEPLGATIRSDGASQYVISFQAESVREVVQLVAEQGGWLCERQTLLDFGE